MLRQRANGDNFAGMIQQVLHELTALGLATGVARSSMVYALVSACHVLGIALLLGPIILVDVRLLGGLRGLDLDAIVILRRTAKVGVGLLLITGVLLFSSKPAEYLANPAMQLKLLVIGTGLANALAFEGRARHAGLSAAMSDKAARLMGAASITAWLLALLLGRWIAFV